MRALFFAELVRRMPFSLRRPYLTVVQIHAIGNRSLVIIAASGAAVGLRAGAAGLLHAAAATARPSRSACWSALSLVRELGPVLTALLFAGRAGTSLTAEIGLMKAGEQLVAMEMMAVDPRARVLAPRFMRRHHRDAAARRGVLGGGHPRRVCRRAC